MAARNTKLRGPCPVMEEHHLLPRQFRDFFEKAGLNIDDFKLALDARKHRLRPNGVHTSSAGDWNGVWEDFFENNANATSEEILKQLEKMKVDFGL